jgi:predicted dehydrogenase
MPHPKNSSLTRRRFLAHSAAAIASTLAAPYLGWVSTASGAAPSKDLRVASFGANGRAWGDITSMTRVENTTLVAVAEVDSQRLDKLSASFPKTTVYNDWRQLLDQEAKNLDAVLVATPDHMHAPISMAAMQLGLHVYCEKPMARTLHEARTLRNFAADHHLVTQMGNQVSSASGNRTPVRLLQERIVGDILSVHSINPKSWGRMSPLPGGSDPVPEGLDWDLWLGVGKERPYLKGEFHPSNWRRRIGYGTGTLGDMGCHIYHPWFMGLDLRAPSSIASLGNAPVDEFSWPTNCKVQYTFPGNKITGKKPYTFTWYDGSQRPPAELAEALGDPKNMPKSGSVVIGTEGILTIPHGGSSRYGIFRDGIRSEDPIEPEPSSDHHAGFANAIRGEGDAPISNFDYSGWMTEAVLLGNVAIRVPGETLQWDGDNLAFPGNKKANALVKEAPSRHGWEIKGL